MGSLATQREMKMKHKHAEILHAIADGIPVQFKWGKEDWADFDERTHVLPNYRNQFCQWRIKPAEVPQWRKDMAQALKGGGKYQYHIGGDMWIDVSLTAEEVLSIEFEVTQDDLRIRPEPDQVVYTRIEYINAVLNTYTPAYSLNNLRLVFDANGNLKDAEVL
jgi:hypothetical protein